MNIFRDVLNGTARWSCEQADCLEWLPTVPERAASVVAFSSPYEDQRTYGVGFVLKGQDWVDWMRRVVVACCRVSSGLVLANMSAPVRDHKYSPAVEWLVADLTRLDGIVCGPSPYAWVKSVNDPEADGNATPGSGGSNYQRRDWEPIYAFALPDRLPLAWSDNTAFGKPPKYGAGGEFSSRDKNGRRANAPGPSRRANGEYKNVLRQTKRQIRAGEDVMVEQYYTPPKISNPGNVIRQPVGGGKCGSPIAHKGEAPMTLGVMERLVCWFAPPDSVVLDPFTGTGTTPHAAYLHGRRFVGCDIRQSQVDLCARRLATVTPAMFTDAA